MCLRAVVVGYMHINRAGCPGDGLLHRLLQIATGIVGEMITMVMADESIVESGIGTVRVSGFDVPADPFAGGTGIIGMWRWYIAFEAGIVGHITRIEDHSGSVGKDEKCSVATTGINVMNFELALLPVR